MKCFLRRIAYADHIKRDRVGRRAFMCRKGANPEPALSYTEITEEVAAGSFEEYRNTPWLESGDKPALAYLTDEQFNLAGGERPARDVQSEPFGEQHCTTACPVKDVAEILAFHATQNGMLAPHISVTNGVTVWKPASSPPFAAWMEL